MALPASEKSTSTGLDANIAGMLAYFVIPAFIFLVMKETSRFVRYHSFQAIILWISSLVVWIVIRVFFMMPLLWVIMIPLSMIIWLAFLVVWIICMVKAFQGEEFKLPVIGDIAVQQMDKF
jgi:uncharacterized membrane protein